MNRLKAIRQAKGYSQKYIAISLGVAQPTVFAWQSGKANPSNKNVVRLSELLNVSADYLLGITDNEHDTEKRETIKPASSQVLERLTDKLRMLTDQQLIQLRGYVAGKYGK